MPHGDGASSLQRGKLSRNDLIRDKAYIDGKWIEADGSASIDVDDPFTGEIIGKASVETGYAGIDYIRSIPSSWQEAGSQWLAHRS